MRIPAPRRLARPGLPLLILGLLGCRAAAGVATNENGSLTEAEVVELIQEYDAAWDRRDLEALQRVLADDYVYFSSRGDVRSRQWILEELVGNPAYRVDRAERAELQVQVRGSAAVVGSRWRGEGSYEGEPFRDDQRCSLVLVRESEGLRIASEHCTAIVP